MTGMRESLTWVGAAVLGLSSSVGAVTIRAGEDNTDFIVVKPGVNVVNIYAVGDGVGVFASRGFELNAVIGDGNEDGIGGGLGIEPEFMTVSFGTIVDEVPFDSGTVPGVAWFPQPTTDALQIPLTDTGAVDLSLIRTASVVFIDKTLTVDLPTTNPTDPTSQDLIGILTINVDPAVFSSSPGDIATYDLDLSESFLLRTESDGEGGSVNITSNTTLDKTLVVALGGDADLDGSVTLGDLGILLDNLGAAGGWEQANFDDDSFTTLADLGTILDNLGSTVFVAASPSSSPQSIPEPGTLAILVLSSFAAFRRRTGRVKLCGTRK